MSADQMTPAERVRYHAERVAAAAVQAREIAHLGWTGPETAVLDTLAYAHAVDAARAAKEMR